MRVESFESQIRLELTGIPSTYSPADLSRRADDLMQALEDLLQIGGLLTHSRLAYRLSHNVDAQSRTATHVLLLHLLPKVSTQLELFMDPSRRESAESGMARDWQTVVEAFRTAPQRCDAARVQFAVRIAQAVRDHRPEALPVLPQATVALLKAPVRKISGRFYGAPWQLQLPRVGVDWDANSTHLYARVSRERDGFSLCPLNQRLPGRRGAGRLRMDFPPDLDTLAILDRATHTGKPQSILVRLGREPGDVQPCCADFLGFSDASAS